MDVKDYYKKCTKCQYTWKTMRDFVHDPTLSVNGYQASFGNPEDGLFLLTHRRNRCGSTLAVAAGDFKPYYDGPAYSECKLKGQGCPLLCLDIKKLEPCSNSCSMAWVRVVLQHLLKHELPLLVS